MSANYQTWVSPVEAKIITRIVVNALTLDLKVQVVEPEEGDVMQDWSEDIADIEKNVAATDMTVLKFKEAATDKAIGSILLIHGNGSDVASDWTDNETMTKIVGFVLD